MTMMSMKIVRIALAVAIVANVAIGFAPSTKFSFTSRTAPQKTTTSNSLQLHPQQCLYYQQQQPYRRRMMSSGLCVSRQQKNEYLETTPNNNSSIENNGELNTAGVGTTGLAQVVLDQDHYYETAIRRTIGWVAAAIGFGISLGFVAGSETSEEFFAGYLLEQSLSIDNLLVFLLLFEYFKIPLESQNRVLNWGIIGAIVMRAIMIGAGAVAIQKFHAVLLVFAAILIFSSGKVILGNEDNEEEDLSENQIVKFSNSLISSTDKFDGDRFFTTVNGIKTATPMLLCMVAVEVSDVIFAVDSIPAVFGVTEVRSFLFVVCYCLSPVVPHRMYTQILFSIF
jgi:predicted tellurium resistance membrane protein TerC